MKIRKLSENRSVKLIEEALKTVEEIGVSKTIEALREARVIQHGDRIKVEFIVKTCCNEFNIEHEELISGRSNGTRVQALTVCAVLLQKYTEYDNVQIAGRLRKSNDLISKYSKSFYSLNKVDEHHAKTLLNHDKIASKVETFIKSLSNEEEKKI